MGQQAIYKKKTNLNKNILETTDESADGIIVEKTTTNKRSHNN